MPISYAESDEPCAEFQALCAPEEADLLLEWLRRTPHPVADLSTCGDVHSALFQLLLAGGVQLIGAPEDAILAECLDTGGCHPFMLIDNVPKGPVVAADPAGRETGPSS